MQLPLGQDLLIRLRSRRLRAMMKRKDPALDFPLADIAPRPVPKIIWSYWHSGEADAPETAARCFDSWRRLNPGWELRVLDETSHAEHAGMSDVGTAHVANWTDVLRTRLPRRTPASAARRRRSLAVCRLARHASISHGAVSRRDGGGGGST